MCTNHSEKCCCQNPEKRKPKDCTPEQIKTCHGDTKQHPCENIKRKNLKK